MTTEKSMHSFRALQPLQSWTLALAFGLVGVVALVASEPAAGEGAPQEQEKPAAGEAKQAESAKTSGAQEKPQEKTEEKAPQSDAERQAELERKFAETLTNVTMVGRWRLVRNGKLGEEREDKYTITKAVKLGSLWIISARVQYGDKDVTLPVPVQVKWAGDTPVISITNAGLPGLGTYTARVLVYDGMYTGTWSGGDHGGLMSGTIVKNVDSAEGGAEGR